MDCLIHKPTSFINSSILLSGSKSISNRLLMIKAISGLSFVINNLSTAEDTETLQQLLFFKKRNYFDIKHAGTDMRFLTAYLATQSGEWLLTGSERMQQRPIADLVNALRQLGADISYENKDGYPPLRIKGMPLNGGRISINGSVSSQFISALLLISPLFKNPLEVSIEGAIVSRPYIDMTISLMRKFGISVTWKNEQAIVVLPSDYNYKPSSFFVESDWSSASYWYSIIALSEEGASVELNYLTKQSTQADSVVADLYEQLGVSTIYKEQTVILEKKQHFHLPFNFIYDFTNCPDIAQTVAVTCVGLKVNCHLKGLSTLKIKETDRIQALKTELEKFDADVDATDNELRIDMTRIRFINSLSISTYKDHRMAMSFLPLVMKVNSIVIENSDVVNKSYPNFWKNLEQLGFSIETV